MKSYAMFTDAGNAMINGVVMTAKSAGLDWDEVLEVLEDIATLDGFEEATDTAVRECVYMALQNG
jgi:2-hydroxychromene-2-carboxylate isomerase